MGAGSAVLTGVVQRLHARMARRPAATAAALCLVLSMLFIGPGLLPGKTLSNSDALWFEPPWIGVKPPELARPSNPELGDAPRHLQLFLRESARAFPDVSLWNPAIMAGRPFHANAQSAIFGPYTLPAYILPFWTALGWIAVLKLWVAAFGTFLLARSLRIGFGGALIAGLVFALNLKLVTWVTYPAMSVWTWMPWLLLLTDRLVRRPDLLSGAGLAAVVGLQFLCGHPESSFHVLLASVAFLALRLWQRKRLGAGSRAGLARPLLAFVGAVAGGTALAAVTLVPFGELLWSSADLSDRAAQSVDVHLPLQDAIGIFLPDWWGRPTQTPLRPFLLERALYAGALPLMLAGAGLVLRPTAERISVAVFGFLWLALALGLPPLLQVITRLPVFSSGHNTRLVVITMLALALLAGWGVDDLAQSRRLAPSRRRLAVLVAAVLLVLPLAIAIAVRASTPRVLGDALRVAWLLADSPTLVTNPDHIAVIRLAALILWLTLAGCGLALLVLRLRGRLGVRLFIVLAALLVCVDLFRAGMGYNPAINRRLASVPATPAIRVLQRQDRLSRFVSTREIPQNVIPMRFGLQEARGYDLPIIRRVDRLWRREVDPRAQSVAAGLLDIPLELQDVTPRALRVLRLLGVTHLLHGTTGRAAAPPYRPEPPFAPLRSPGLSQIYSGPDARVYRIEDALPRTWVVHAQRSVDDGEAALDAVSAPGFDARRVAVTERRVPGVPGEPGRDADPPGRSRVIRYDPERVRLRVQTSRPGLVVLDDTFFPGWAASVDGRESPVERVDYVLRGVRVGAGSHTVEFRYEPLSWTLGWIISLVALGGLLIATLAGWRRRRAGAGPQPPSGVGLRRRISARA